MHPLEALRLQVAPGVKLTSGVLKHASVSTAVVIHFSEKVSD